jgi:hypothetical protein
VQRDDAVVGIEHELQNHVAFALFTRFGRQPSADMDREDATAALNFRASYVPHRLGVAPCRGYSAWSVAAGCIPTPMRSISCRSSAQLAAAGGRPLATIDLDPPVDREIDSIWRGEIFVLLR